MKKSEKIIAALLIMAIGILFIILRTNFIGILMTVAGVSLAVFGVVALVNRSFAVAVVKITAGILLVVCGWAVVEAVLYILAGALLVFGTLYLYDLLKNGKSCPSVWQNILTYAQPLLIIGMGILLLFHQASVVSVVCILCGCLAILEGGILLFDGLTQE